MNYERAALDLTPTGCAHDFHLSVTTLFPAMHIAVCLATYKRPDMLNRLLASLARQETKGQFTFEVVVVDNDSEQAAKPVVRMAEESFPTRIQYLVEPERSIALVRNRAISATQSDFIAFIDDDEFADPDWLQTLFTYCEATKADGVLGPVRPYYPAGTPQWVVKGGFFDRPEHPLGYKIPWQESRTGNVLLRRSILDMTGPVFSLEFGTGGSDVDFFRRMAAAGRTFFWCPQAAVHEEVPSSRWKRRVLLRRALLRGRNSFRHPEGRYRNLGKAIIAIPLYALVLPVLAVFAHHLFMRYLVKTCDHLGRLGAAVGVEFVKQRDM